MRNCGYKSGVQDSFQIALLGDSHAFGLGVSDGQTYAALLNDAGYPANLVACSSFGTARAFIKCEALVRQGIIRKPTALVLHYCENDSLENAAFVNDQFRYSPPPPKEFTQTLGASSHPVRYGQIHYLLPDILRPLSWPNALEYQLLKHLSFGIPIHRARPVQAEPTPPARPFDEDLERIIRHHLQRPEFEEVRKIILLDALSPGYFPSAEIRYETGRMAGLRDRLSRSLPDVEVVFITPDEKDLERYFFRYDDHINAAGHAYFFSKIRRSVDKGRE
ncbi:MAG: hypothetical protein RLY31_2343 [Bacteroidota bacterium]|jgi:hypothetical protein